MLYILLYFKHTDILNSVSIIRFSVGFYLLFGKITSIAPLDIEHAYILKLQFEFKIFYY